jgi:hypothetical protein
VERIDIVRQAVQLSGTAAVGYDVDEDGDDNLFAVYEKSTRAWIATFRTADEAWAYVDWRSGEGKTA